jgi:hypothetical protein
MEGESQIAGEFVMTQREWASGILIIVGQDGFSGSFPSAVSGFNIGRALSRVCINSPEANDMDKMLAEINAGWRHVDNQRKKKADND